jgi:hypothetical protein
LFGASGLVQNVLSWPDTWILPDSASSILYGQPVLSMDSTLPVLYANATPPLNGGGSGAPAMSTVTDADLGSCRQAVFSATPGGVNSNFAYIDGFSGAASKDTVFSILVKSNVDAQIGINIHNGSSYNAINTDKIFLKAGQVKRLVYGQRNIQAGPWTLYWYPITGSPTVKFSHLQVDQGDTGQAGTTQQISKIAKLGAFGA